MSEESKNRVSVLLSDDEHEKLKRIVKTTRRTLDQELAYRAFEKIKNVTVPMTPVASRKARA